MVKGLQVAAYILFYKGKQLVVIQQGSGSMFEGQGNANVWFER
jgi:hypothetical protein